ncbi:MAG: response regulator [Candidatus Omnitrophica bacterium]|nr:response regulator [Candidatus Omnitrophota bacterium]
MGKVPFKRILVVDDETDILVYVAKILRRENYEVNTTASGKEALEIAKRLLPDLLILDIMLPDMSGDEVATALTEDPATAEIPIIFLTGIIRKGEESEGLKSGKHYVLAKPITSQELSKVVKQVFYG